MPTVAVVGGVPVMIGAVLYVRLACAVVDTVTTDISTISSAVRFLNKGMTRLAKQVMCMALVEMSSLLCAYCHGYRVMKTVVYSFARPRIAT